MQSKLGCAIPDESPELQMREQCYVWENGNLTRRPYMGQKCKDAYPVKKEGFYYQIGGPAKSRTSGKYRQTTCGGGRIFAMPFEVSFAINFTVVDGLPRGCGILDGDWRFNQSHPTGDETGLNNKIFIGNMLKGAKDFNIHSC